MVSGFVKGRDGALYLHLLVAKVRAAREFGPVHRHLLLSVTLFHHVGDDDVRDNFAVVLVLMTVDTSRVPVQGHSAHVLAMIDVVEPLLPLRVDLEGEAASIDLDALVALEVDIAA